MIKRKIRPLISRLLVLLFFSLVIPLSFLLLHSKPFLVNEIIVTTDYDIKANPNLWSILLEKRQKNLLTLNTIQLSQKIKAADIILASVKVNKKFPGKIFIEIKSRQAIANIENLGKFYLVDQEGLIFKITDQRLDLPFIIFEPKLQNLKLGSRIDKDGKNILFILNRLKDKEKVINIIQKNKNLELQLNNHLLVLLVADVEANKLNTLQIILDRFKMNIGENKIPSQIDLRFNNPVISYPR